MHPRSRTPAHDDQMSVRSQGSRILWADDLPSGVTPQSHKIQKYLRTLKFPRKKKGLQRYIGFVNYYRNYIPQLSEKNAPFHELVKSDKPAKIDQELRSHQQVVRQRMWTLTQTTTAKLAVCTND